MPMGKDKHKVRVSFPGYNAFQVTGSMTLIETKEMKILVEAGLVQGGTVLEDWRANTRKLPFRPSEIDFIFIGHAHADHTLLIPRLFAMGCRARIIAPTGTKDLFAIMAPDSAYIISRDAELLSKTAGKTMQPFYTVDDVELCLPYFEEHNFGVKINVGENLTFRFTPSGHLLNAAQIELWVRTGNHVAKIGYTSDLGSALPRRFINSFEPMQHCNLLIGESTYARELRPLSAKDRRNDLAKLESVIRSAVETKGRVLIPVFALDRAQNMAGFLFDIFGEDEAFTTPVLIDSPLAVKMFEYMRTHASEEDREYMERLLAWPNLHLVEAYEESKAWIDSGKHCVVLSSAGMLTAGRSRRWAAALLPDSNAHILFCGFSVENSLAGQLKNVERKTVNIDGRKVKCRCGITDLHSFSGHMGRDGLLEYYSNIEAEKIALVHGEFDYKVQFAEDLQEKLASKNKTGRVICVNRSTEILV